MKRLIILVIMACTFGACHNSNEQSANISGTIANAIGDKVYLQVQTLDTVVSFAIDTNGFFSGKVDVKEGLYARLVNQKVAVPLYLKPGANIKLSFDRSELKKGAYNTVKVTGDKNLEIKMMLDYYSKQEVKTSQELFVLTPKDFQGIQEATAVHNLKIIDEFVAKNKAIDKDFVQIFKYQIQIPLAAAFFYYPMYHRMMNPKDKSIVPDNFNFFADRLPKNDLNIYQKVYRYNTYEISVWNTLLMQKVMPFQNDMEKLFNTYFDELKKLNLAQPIMDDVTNNFIMQQYNNAPENIKAIFKARYKDFVKKERYLKNYEKIMK